MCHQLATNTFNKTFVAIVSEEPSPDHCLHHNRGTNSELIQYHEQIQSVFGSRDFPCFTTYLIEHSLINVKDVR